MMHRFSIPVAILGLAGCVSYYPYTGSDGVYYGTGYGYSTSGYSSRVSHYDRDYYPYWSLDYFYFGGFAGHYTPRYTYYPGYTTFYFGRHSHRHHGLRHHHGGYYGRHPYRSHGLRHHAGYDDHARHYSRSPDHSRGHERDHRRGHRSDRGNHSHRSRNRSYEQRHSRSRTHYRAGLGAGRRHSDGARVSKK